MPWFTDKHTHEFMMKSTGSTLTKTSEDVGDDMNLTLDEFSNPKKSVEHHCSICDQCFAFDSLLTQHMHMHSNEKRQFCDRRISQKANLKIHQKHKVEHLQQGRKTERNKASLSTSFEIPSALSSRISPNDVEMNDTDVKPINGVALTLDALERNIAVHAEELSLLPCMFCNKGFQHSEELRHHVVVQHRPTLCEPAVLRVEEGLSPMLEMHITASSPEQEINDESEDGELSCKVCGLSCESAVSLETHMRKHKDSFTYGCNVCGRRFKEPWFLKNHMRTHSSKARGKSQPDSEGPATINNVIVQESFSGHVVSPYKMCMVCGFLFPSKDNLKEHSKVHNKDMPDDDRMDDYSLNQEIVVPQEAFLQMLQLRPHLAQNCKPVKLGKWIPELDPFNTYQAWQLATKGKVAVGRENVKDPGQIANSENEEEPSDKEESSEHWTSDKGNHGATMENLDKTKIKSSSLCQSGPPTVGDIDVDPKLTQNKTKPTNCTMCGKIFRTYHQLVLHSRVHRKGRKSVENPPNSVDSSEAGTQSVDSVKTIEDHSPETDKPEEGSEEGSEDGALGEGPSSDRSEDGSERGRSREAGSSGECSYCGKSFRSNYYLNIHLRIHTGEKPHRCPLCDYAAAQKTSLKYHLERHHKGEQKKPEEKNDSLKNSSASPKLEVVPKGSDEPVQESMDSTKLLADSLGSAKDLDADFPRRKHKLNHPPPPPPPPPPPVFTNAAFSNVSRELPDLNRDTSLHHNHPIFCNAALPYCKKSKDEKVMGESHRNDSDPKVVLDEENSKVSEECLKEGLSEGGGQQNNTRNTRWEPAPINDQCYVSTRVKLEDFSDQSECSFLEKPLNLCTMMYQRSLCSNGSPLGNAATSVSKSALLSNTCPFCTYRTLYPEVLVMHQRVVHKYNADPSPINGMRSAVCGGSVKSRRTGCPPALLGQDVSSLLATKETNREFSRRTKSPVPATSPESSNLLLGKAKSSSSSSSLSSLHQSQCNNLLPSAAGSRSSGDFKAFKATQNSSAHVENYRSMHTELRQMPDVVQRMERSGPSEPSNSKRNTSERPCIKLDYESDGPRGSLVRFDSLWASNVSKMCLTDVSENQGGLDSHERTAKKMKLNSPLRNDQPIFGARRGVQGRNVKLSPEIPSVQARNSGIPSKSGSPLDSNGVDPHWNVLKLLKSYSPQDLASLYNNRGPSNSGDPNIGQEGKRPFQYLQHSNSMSQKRSISHPHSGSLDKEEYMTQ